MATPAEKLADALEALHELQKNGSVAIRSADLSRTHRERLVQNGFLEEVIGDHTEQKNSEPEYSCFQSGLNEGSDHSLR
jgi:hypothetical protein